MQITKTRMTPIQSFVAALCLIAVVAFQTGLYAYFAGRLSAEAIRGLYYGFWAGCGVFSLVCLVRNPSLLKILAPVALVLFVIVVLTLLRPPLGVASRSLMMSCYAIATLSVLVGSLAENTIFKISAAVIVMTAASFLAEMYVPGFFSTTIGRSAGLFVNPNVAAGALILGGAAVWPFVPKRWAIAYGVIVFFGVAATVSRTGLLVLFVASILTAVTWYLRNRPAKLSASREALSRGAAALVLCAFSVLAAWQLSPSVRLAAEQSAETAMAVADPLATIFSDELGAEAGPIVDAVDAAEALGASNSGAARVVLMANGLHNSTVWGIGVEEAHALAPHNQYLLFGIAFGFSGWVAGVGLVFAVFWASRSNLLFALCFAGILVFSHDLSVLALSASVAIGVGSGAALRLRDISSSAEQTYVGAEPWFIGV